MAGFLVVPSGTAADALTGAVFDTVASTPQTITGLTNGTSYVAYRVSDASATFTPAAASAGLSLTYIGITPDSSGNTGDSNWDGADNPTIDFTSVTEGDQLYMAMLMRSGIQTLTQPTFTLDGTSLTLIGGTDLTVSRVKVQFFKVTATAGMAGNATCLLDPSATGALAGRMAVWKVTGSVGTETVTGSPVSTGGGASGPETRTLDANTAADGVVLGAAVAEDAGGVTISWSGITERGTDFSMYGDGTTLHVGSIADSTTTAETPRAMSATNLLDGMNAAAVLVLEPA